MQFYKKDRVSNAIRIDGKPILWEPVGRDTGVRQFNEVTDATVVKVLNDFADNRKMGVVRISPQIYESLKKKRATTSVKPLPRGFGPTGPTIRAMDRDSVLLRAKAKPVQPLPPRAAGAGVAAVVEASPPPANKPIAPAPKPAPPHPDGGDAAKTPTPVKRTRARKSVVDAAESPPEAQ